MNISNDYGRFNDIYKISKEVFNLAEIGSKEFKTSALLSDFLKKNGFKIKKPYKGMKTAFRAEYGSGRPVVGLLCEEDALPNGHSCGHNLIAAWSVGTAIKLKEKGYKGKIVVIGTPSEEGIGEYAGSKDMLVKAGAFKDIDFVIGVHPDSQWSVGCQSPADITTEIIFEGKASHLEEAEKGINALDALIATYLSIRNATASFNKYMHVLVGMYIKEGGKASNIIPDKSILEIDLRSTKTSYLIHTYNRIKKIAIGIGKTYKTKVTIKQITPIYKEYKNALVIDKILYNNLKKQGVNAAKLYEKRDQQIGATDEANVSKAVPTGHIDFKIAPKSVAGHSDRFRELAGSNDSLGQLRKTIIAAVDTCIQIENDQKVKKEIEKLKKM
ncbi:MAG: amidohydrolase [Candidatus Parvarchaeum sp.]|jgi:amidohydrolase|nr:amidohydrolase [Candidatus Parvarchaeota archaeon]MCW1295812.1 amidohydrolase [Candidatus Parvarchaeum tengchongense]MCW1299007.1 amidohydrolase [Candidatus Parvarchaeum tengchongense]